VETRETIDGFINYWAKISPEKKAIISERNKEEITYFELNNLINYFCNLYKERLTNKTICALLLDDSIVSHAIVHSVFRLGATLVPIDSDLGFDSIKKVLNHANPAIIFYSKENKHADALKLTENKKSISYCGNLNSFYSQINKLIIFKSLAKKEDVAMLAYTSGTTSNAKGVILRHKHLVNSYYNANKYMYQPSRVGCVFRIATLGTLGIHFFYPQYGGGTTVLLQKLTIMNASKLWGKYNTLKLDFLYLVPSLVKLLNHLGTPQTNQLNGLIVSAGALLQKKEQILFQEKFKVILRNIYGLTESSFAVFYGSTNDGIGSNTIGPALSIEARIVDEHGEISKKGEVGELQYKGSMVSDGYFNNDEATNEVFSNGWLSTGDLVKKNKKKEYEIVGRKKDVIIRGGFNIHPADIEEVILEQKKVINTYAFGVPNEIMGDEIYVFVQIEKNHEIDRDYFVKNIKDALGQFRSPDKYFFTNENIPLNAAGKIDRKIVLLNFKNN
jgi:acyl-CoA synthetase (AMP-forming)/AMP-acid ligase II